MESTETDFEMQVKNDESTLQFFDESYYERGNYQAANSASPPTMVNRHHSKEERYTTWRIFLQHVTTAAHVCTLFYVILVVYICFSNEFVFFTWHPLLLSLGWMLLLTQGVLAISKHNILSGTLPKQERVLWHWVFQVLGLTLVYAGSVVVYINKNDKNKNHLESWHALIGFIAIVATIPTTLNGICTLYGVKLRYHFSPKAGKVFHIMCGIITFILGGVALILSLYTNWFQRYTASSNVILTFGLLMLTIAIGWTLVRPLSTLFNHIQYQI